MKIRSAMFAFALLLVAAIARGDDPATTIRNFFHAYENAAPLQNFWADDAPSRELFDRTARLVHRVRCVELDGLHIDNLVVNGESAHARVSFALTKRERTTTHVWGPTLTVYSVSVVRQRDGWRIRDVSLSAEKLADALMAATSESERQALLFDSPELVTRDLVRVLINRAWYFVLLPDMRSAARIAEIAGDIASTIGDTGGVSLRLVVRSIVSRVEGRRAEGRAIAEEGVDVARRVDEPEVLARALVGLGRTYDGEHANKIRLGLFWEAAGLENRVEELGWIVRAYVALEQDSWQTDDYVSLRRFIDEQFRLAKLSGDLSLASGPSMNLGSLYDDLGDYTACVQYAEQGAKYEEDKAPGGLYSTAKIIAARCLRLDGQLDAARALAEQTARWGREVPHNEKVLSYSLIELAHHHFLAGEYAAAERRIRESMDVAEKSGNLLDEHYILLARVQLATGRYADVLESTRLFREGELSGGPSHVAISRTYGAIAHRALGDRNAALADLEMAMAASEEFAERLLGDAGARAKGVAAAPDPFAEAVDLNVELGRIEAALASAERNRGRFLLESLKRGDQRVSKSMTAEEQATELRLEREMSAVNREIFAAEARGTETSEARGRLDRRRVEYEAFRTVLYVRHPNLKTQRGAISVASPKQMVEALPERGAFLEYVVGEKQTHVFIVSGTAEKPLVRVRTLPIGRVALEAKVTAYRTQLARRALSQRSAARALDEILLAPVDDVLRSTRILGIVADGALWQVPFEALIDARGRYRIETHTIFYAPSISIFLEMQAARSRRERRGQPTLLAVADPVVSDVVQRRLHDVYRSTELTRLPEAKAEVEELRRIYGRDASAVYVGAAATETRVKAEIGGRDVVHFATHGILDDASPMYSRLVLAQAKNATGSDADGLLEAWELMDLDLQADLVVLSSCDSARGRYSAGEGMIGMTWAAFVAGARTTVASLWKVSSKSTSTLMVDFHRRLQLDAKSEVATAEALRRAKLRMLRSETKKHPFYWAAFVAIGDPR